MTNMLSNVNPVTAFFTRVRWKIRIIDLVEHYTVSYKRKYNKRLIIFIDLVSCRRELAPLRDAEATLLSKK
jgi:hypothetical protein